MARSNRITTYEIVWMAMRPIQTSPLRATKHPTSWAMVMPEPVRLHELPNASRQLLGGTPPYYNSADGNTIVTHAALRHIETQHLWIVELWPTAPYLSPQESGVVAKACYLSDMDTFRAAIAITPFHDWDAEMFPLRTLREGI